jgi:hypothetical protein
MTGCENIEFGIFRPRVFSYLEAKKSGFFNIFTASEAFRTSGRQSRGLAQSETLRPAKAQRGTRGAGSGWA